MPLRVLIASNSSNLNLTGTNSSSNGKSAWTPDGSYLARVDAMQWLIATVFLLFWLAFSIYFVRKAYV